ncbi:hypothetical protein ACRAWF_13025 [Streptomyces sp. L7]
MRDPSEGGGAASCVSVPCPWHWPPPSRVGGATLALAATAAPPQLVKDPSAYVDPLIGTKNGGNVFPGAVVPFGMLSWSPENTRGSATKHGRSQAATSTAPPASAASASPTSAAPAAPRRGGRRTDHAVRRRRHLVTVGGHQGRRLRRLLARRREGHPGRYTLGLASGATADLAVSKRAGVADFTCPADRPASLLFRVSNSSTAARTRTSTSTPPTAR